MIFKKIKPKNIGKNANGFRKVVVIERYAIKRFEIIISPCFKSEL